MEAEAYVHGVMRGGRVIGQSFIYHNGHGCQEIPLDMARDLKILEEK